MSAVVTLLADRDIDPGKLMLEGIDTSAGPLYSVSEMARFFFCRTSYWARWLDTCHYSWDEPVLDGDGKPVHDSRGRPKTTVVKCGQPPAAHTKKQAKQHASGWKLMLDGELLAPIRTDSNARKYDLALIEKIAHALASNGTIRSSQLLQALRLVHIQAQMAGYLP